MIGSFLHPFAKPTGEHFTTTKLAGAALTLAGVALAQFANRDAADPVRDAPAQVD